MRFGGPGGRAGAGRALHGSNAKANILCQALETRKYVAEGAHVARLFLNPDDFARVGMLGDGGGDFGARQGVQLVEKENGRVRVFAAPAFLAKFVADFATGNQDALGVVYLMVGNQRQEAWPREFLDV